MKKEELADLISEWEIEHGESFYDYFAHDNIDAMEYADFLKEKGFVERSDEIIKECYENSRGWCMDQELMFEITADQNENFNILSEYLLQNEPLLEEALIFLKEEQ